jgi:hypothetical protein
MNTSLMFLREIIIPVDYSHDNTANYFSARLPSATVRARSRIQATACIIPAKGYSTVQGVGPLFPSSVHKGHV